MLKAFKVIKTWTLLKSFLWLPQKYDFEAPLTNFGNINFLGKVKKWIFPPTKVASLKELLFAIKDWKVFKTKLEKKERKNFILKHSCRKSLFRVFKKSFSATMLNNYVILLFLFPV